MTDALDLNDRVLADIRAAADIVDVIGEYTTLKKAGNSWKGLCPFHREKTPSFTANRDRGLFYCFGCGAGGDLFGFVRQIERVEFREAAEILARRYGIEIPKRTRKGDDRSEKLREAVGKAHRLYVDALGKAPNRALAYLESRGVPEEAARELAFGFAPEGWDFLARALSSSFTPDILIEAGLLQPGAEGKRPYDRQRDRLVFPIRDERGHVVGFGGRSLSGEEPKYMNSPETPIFAKNRLLYGLPAARDAIRREDCTVLVEGYFDHLALWLSDCRNAVASMGTAFGRGQAEKLRRLAPRAIVCYDGDNAGRNATRRAVPILLAEGLEIRVAAMPAGIDPFDLYRESGGGAVRTALEGAVPFLDWLLAELDPDDAPEERSRKLNVIVEILQSVPDRALLYEYVRKVAAAAGMPAYVLWAGRPARPAAESGTPPDEPASKRRASPPAERRILRSLLSGADGAETLLAELELDIFTDERIGRIFRALKDLVNSGEPLEIPSVVNHLASDDERALLSEVLLEEALPGDSKAISLTINGLTQERDKRLLKTLKQELQAAQQADDKEQIQRLLGSTNSLARKIHGPHS